MPNPPAAPANLPAPQSPLRTSSPMRVESGSRPTTATTTNGANGPSAAPPTLAPPSQAASSPPLYSPAPNSPNGNSLPQTNTGDAPVEDDFDWFEIDSGPAQEEVVHEYESRGLYGLDCCYLPVWAQFLAYLFSGLTIPAAPALISYLVVWKPGDPNLFDKIGPEDSLTLSTEIARW
ncbi:uncharacterized protein EV422DRAFT_104838 [Fimicolochytrium jonesii]|uniref:uncharacterized protein n=1 Tax=Fimicolochytrium jonesii TaxID=1396493 RepID=UPI0022FEEE2E|nr:uncharacterized protein EV422DRAFT_104838 [Fimicolochytrium jonesii]KAI8819728.1 hypothetical protein EV422DRAFT_104838 [Fimicolochytrium jonesii]